VPMTITAVKRVMFEEASASSDWKFPYRLIVPEVAGWDETQDEVVLAISPDDTVWDDYGRRSRTYPPGDAYPPPPWFQASSLDASGIVTLVDPNQIDIRVPYTTMRQLGPGV